MATTEEVKKLAALARISVTDAELEKFTSEFDAILEYIGQLESVQIDADKNKAPLRNVMREDSEPHAGGLYTEKIVAQFSGREGDALSVKQIISHE